MIAIDVPTEQLRAFCRKWKVTEFALFGSVTRDDFTPASDVDVMVEFAEGAPWTLSSWLDMREELIALFGREVDLAERSGVEQMRNYLRREEILNTAVLLDVA
jgi:predicted nucleotidyltransferase